MVDIKKVSQQTSLLLLPPLSTSIEEDVSQIRLKLIFDWSFVLSG